MYVQIHVIVTGYVQFTMCILLYNVCSVENWTSNEVFFSIFKQSAFIVIRRQLKDTLSNGQLTAKPQT